MGFSLFEYGSGSDNIPHILLARTCYMSLIKRVWEM